MRASLVRSLCLDVVARVIDGDELADRALNRALRAHRQLHSTERRLVSEATYAIVRSLRRLDYLWQQLAGDVWAKQPTPEKHRLRLALALLTELDHSPTQAASLAAVEPWAARALAELRPDEVRWPEDRLERLGVRYSMPDALVSLFAQAYPHDVEALVAALDARAPLTLRANTLAGDRTQLVEALSAEGLETQQGRWSPWAVTLGARVNAFGLAAYTAGRFEVQDEGSQLIAQATGAKAGELAVDACAGGGGKTLAMAAMMANKGRIVACDVTAKRLADVMPRARRAKAFNLETRVVAEDASGDQALSNLVSRASLVLVDAPCSGTGALRRRPDARWRLTAEGIASFPALQRQILDRYARLVKPGGRLVYATCSILPEENEAVADAFLAAHPEFRPLPFDHLPPETAPEGRLKLLPHLHGTDGFFAAGFQRL